MRQVLSKVGIELKTVETFMNPFAVVKWVLKDLPALPCYLKKLWKDTELKALNLIETLSY